jgi:hypothetical protein
VTKATTPKQPSGWNWGLPVTDQAFEPYVTALGQLTLAWNDLHETLAIVFSMVMGGGDVGQYLAIWHAIKVDRAQREILLAAAKVDELRGPRYPRLVPDLEWICRKAEAVEDARNDALHSPLWGSQRGPGSTLVIPLTGLGHVRAQKLMAKDLLTATLDLVADHAHSNLFRGKGHSCKFLIIRGSLTTLTPGSIAGVRSVDAQSWLSIALTSRALDGMADSRPTDMVWAEGLAGQALAASPRSLFGHYASDRDPIRGQGCHYV